MTFAARFGFLALTLLLLAASCTTARSASRRALPFHVAIAPLGTHTAPGTQGDLALHVDGHALEQRLARELERIGFARATVLALPEGTTPDEFRTRPLEAQDEFWIAAAERAGADLVLAGDVSFRTTARGAMNEKFWLNLPLFLLGGPFCYVVDDRSYTLDARLAVQLHELHALSTSRATLSDARALLTRAEARVDEARLDFVDRAHGNVLQYAASLVVPAGLLARTGSDVEAALAQAAESELARRAADRLATDAESVARADRVAGFWLEPGAVIEDDGRETRARGAFLLAEGQDEGLEELAAFGAGPPESALLGVAEPDDARSSVRQRVLRLPFDVRVPSAPDGRLRLVARSSSREGTLRSFTLVVHAARDDDL